MADLDAILGRLERLEAENTALQERLGSLESPARETAPSMADAGSPVTRRQLLRNAGLTAGTLALGAVAASAATLGRAEPARAAGDDGSNIAIGTQYLNVQSTTKLQNVTNSATVLLVQSNDVNGATLEGKNTSTGRGVFGYGEGGIGVHGYSGSGRGVYGYGGDDVGVFGDTLNGRGGVFRGKKAQLQLQASSATTHPSSGARGDFFVDSRGRLWFCKGGANWKLLA